MLCMPLDPEYRDGAWDENDNADTSMIYPVGGGVFPVGCSLPMHPDLLQTEYQTSDQDVLQALHDLGVPCAGWSSAAALFLPHLMSSSSTLTVCKHKTQAAKMLTVPSRTSCPSGFNMEYQGYIMGWLLGKGVNSVVVQPASFPFPRPAPSTPTRPLGLR